MYNLITKKLYIIILNYHGLGPNQRKYHARELELSAIRENIMSAKNSCLTVYIFVKSYSYANPQTNPSINTPKLQEIIMSRKTIRHLLEGFAFPEHFVFIIINPLNKITQTCRNDNHPAVCSLHLAVKSLCIRYMISYNLFFVHNQLFLVYFIIIVCSYVFSKRKYPIHTQYIATRI